MKRLLTLLAVVAVAGLILSCGGNAAKKSGGLIKKAEAPKREGYPEYYPTLYGDIESVIIRKYYVEDKFGEIVKEEMKESRKFTFNQHGDVIEEVGYNSDESIDDKTSYKYDPVGNRIEEASYNDDGNLGGKTLYKYDSKGNVVEIMSYQGEIMAPIELTEYEIVYCE